MSTSPFVNSTSRTRRYSDSSHC